MTGLLSGRPFAAKILRTLASFRPLAPSPNTVSVGNATSPPSARDRAAASRPAGLLGTISAQDEASWRRRRRTWRLWLWWWRERWLDICRCRGNSSGKRDVVAAAAVIFVVDNIGDAS